MSTPPLKIKKSSEESLLSCNAVKAFLIYTTRLHKKILKSCFVDEGQEVGDGMK